MDFFVRKIARLITPRLVVVDLVKLSSVNNEISVLLS